MTSNRPYLIRALYDWIADNNLTPYVLADARQPGVRVPPFAVKDGQVVLNLAMRAVANLELGNEHIRFSARFSGASHEVIVPVHAVLAIYAQENGQGMMFPAEPAPDAVAQEPNAAAAAEPAPAEPTPPARGAHLRVIK